MARRTQTYAIRLAVEGGGQVKAELVSVGQSGEQSLKRIEIAGGKASGGLMDLGRQAELLRGGIRTLGGALAGVTTVGGLAALVNRSISAGRTRSARPPTRSASVWRRCRSCGSPKASGVEHHERAAGGGPRCERRHQRLLGGRLERHGSGVERMEDDRLLTATKLD